MRKRSVAVVAVAAACALAGCKEITGEDGGGVTPICQVIGNGGDVTASSGPSGQFEDAVLAFDGRLDSYASFGPGASATGTISGAGVSRMAGEYAGIAITRPSSGAITVNITTYRDGVLLETRQAGSVNYTPTGDQSTCPGHCATQNGLAFFGIATLFDFDTIEAQISMSALPQALQVRELCVK